MTDPDRPPRLSLGLPVFNGERFLAEAVEALLAQTYPDFELIISDNGSTDGTQAIAEAYERADPRVRYLRHAVNRGSAFNHNIVVLQARGELFKWVSDDDLYAPTLLERCVEALDARPEVVCAHAWTAFIDESSSITHKVAYRLDTDNPSAPERFRSLLHVQGGDDIYGVIRTAVLRRMAPVGSYHLSDRTFVAELALHGRFHNVEDYLYFRRDHCRRTDRVAASLRLRCARLDPRRANRWLHPGVRLVVEYLLAYLTAIARSPLGRRDRLRCTWYLIGWLAGHLHPLYRRRLLDSPDPAVRALGAKSWASRLSARPVARPVARPAARPPVGSVALYGYLGSGNIGNDASVETVLAFLRSEHPQVRLSCITIAPEAVAARYGLPATPLAWRPAGRAGSGRAGSGRAGSGRAGAMIGRLVDVPRSLVLSGRADAVVVPGMGVLEESLGVRPWGLPLWMFLTAAACRLRGRPFVLLDVGAEPIRDPVTRRLLVATVALASHVSYRDEWSADAMRGAGARRPARVAADLAFAHDDAHRPAPAPGRTVVGVMAYYGPGDDPVAGSAVRGTYVTTLTRALVRLLDAGDTIVLLGGDQVDLAVAHEVAAAVRGDRPQLPDAAVTVCDAATFADVCREMAAAEVVIASRFHNLVAALRLGRPVVSVGYAPKSTRLMAGLGLERFCQDIDELDADRLVGQVRAARAERAVLERQIRDRTDGYARAVTGLLRDVAAGPLGLVGEGGGPAAQDHGTPEAASGGQRARRGGSTRLASQP